MITYKCPLTQKTIKGNALGNHILYTSRKFKIDRKELRFLIFKNTFDPFLFEKDNFRFLYQDNLLSLPDFKLKYNLPYAITLFILDYLGIPKRNMKESCFKITAKKNKATCQNKYGVDNPSQLSWVKRKKDQTFLKNYGVDNIWKLKNFVRDFAEKSYIEKYGKSLSEVRSDSSRRVWESKSVIEKEKWILNSIRSEKALKKIWKTKGYNKSKLEYKISDLLTELGFPHLHCFLRKVSTKKRYYYDFYLKEYNLIIEINGDYWHANPEIYKSTDLLHYKHVTISAEDIWKKDSLKIDYAKNNGYNVIVIWEKEIKDSEKNGDLRGLIKRKIYNEINKNKKN